MPEESLEWHVQHSETMLIFERVQANLDSARQILKVGEAEAASDCLGSRDADSGSRPRPDHLPAEYFDESELTLLAMRSDVPHVSRLAARLLAEKQSKS